MVGKYKSSRNTCGCPQEEAQWRVVRDALNCYVVLEAHRADVDGSLIDSEGKDLQASNLDTVQDIIGKVKAMGKLFFM
eukprot:1160359-Pelagomonas_calceolata.AAC.1